MRFACNDYYVIVKKIVYWLCGSVIYFSILNVWLVKFCVHYSQQYRVCHQPGPEKYYTPLQPGPDIQPWTPPNNVICEEAYIHILYYRLQSGVSQSKCNVSCIQ